MGVFWSKQGFLDTQPFRSTCKGSGDVGTGAGCHRGLAPLTTSLLLQAKKPHPCSFVRPEAKQPELLLGADRQVVPASAKPRPWL